MIRLHICNIRLARPLGRVGVMITHANIMANCADIYKFMPPDDQSAGVSWLPHFHDMGLVIGIFEPLFGGCPGILMSPGDFMGKPRLWLAERRLCAMQGIQDGIAALLNGEGQARFASRVSLLAGVRSRSHAFADELGISSDELGNKVDEINSIVLKNAHFTPFEFSDNRSVLYSRV